MKRYDERVLHLLLDRYENSLLYEEKNKVHISIFVPVNKRTFPEYFDVTSTEYDTIQEQLLELEVKGLLSLEWGKRKKHIIEKCVLNTEKAEEIYRMLHRLPRKEKERRFLQLCQGLKTSCSSEVCTRFLDWITQRIMTGESIKEYANFENTEAFEKLVRLLYAIETNTEEIFLRQLSINVFHDSKEAEQEVRKAAGILLRFGTESQKSNLEKGTDVGGNSDAGNYEDVLADYLVFRNPSWVMLKGKGRFYVNGQGASGNSFCLRELSGGIGISNEDIEKICWDTNDKPTYVITIENLTSFHQWKLQDEGLCIYLGGYANQPRRKMLMCLHQRFPDIPFYHFGDMDCGGFLIWKNLCTFTGIPFILKGMDLETYEKYSQYGRELTLHDQKQFALMIEDPWFEEQKALFEHILSRGLKLEQECVCFIRKA